MMTLDHCTFARALLRAFSQEHRIPRCEYIELLHNVILTERELVHCRSKAPFDSHNAAQRTIDRKHVDKRNTQVYRCRICFKYHVGGRSVLARKRRAENFRQRHEEVELA